MPAPITFQASFQRAWRDTLQRLNLQHPADLVFRVIVFVLTLFFFDRALGRQQVIEQLYWPVLALAVLGLVFIASLLTNFILAPFRLAREAAARAEIEKDQAVSEKLALSSQLAVIASRQPAIETSLDEGHPQDRLLVVRNTGANADFIAQIRIIEGRGNWTITTRKVFTGSWEGRRPQVEIRGGHQARLRLTKTECSRMRRRCTGWSVKA
jgi:hypothetical protein